MESIFGIPLDDIANLRGFMTENQIETIAELLEGFDQSMLDNVAEGDALVNELYDYMKYLDGGFQPKFSTEFTGDGELKSVTSEIAGMVSKHYVEELDKALLQGMSDTFLGGLKEQVDAEILRRTL